MCGRIFRGSERQQGKVIRKKEINPGKEMRSEETKGEGCRRKGKERLSRQGRGVEIGKERRK